MLNAWHPILPSLPTGVAGGLEARQGFDNRNHHHEGQENGGEKPQRRI